jgi:hypothetical protein
MSSRGSKGGRRRGAGRVNEQGGGHTLGGGRADGYSDATWSFDCEALERVDVDETQLRYVKRAFQFYAEALDNAVDGQTSR